MKNNYDVIAELYSVIMEEIDYEGWAEYIVDVSEFVPKEKIEMLELAAGSCHLSKYLNLYRKNLIVTDISFPMLKRSDDCLCRKVCCDMTRIPFKKEFDFVFCTFDSINYLLKKEYIEKLFYEVKRILADDGIFTFDVSLINNSINNTKYLNRSTKHEGIKIKQISFFDEKTSIHSNKFEFIYPDGSKRVEIHKQKIYPFEMYFELAEKCGLQVYQCFNAFTFDHASANNERAQFLIKKMN